MWSSLLFATMSLLTAGVPAGQETDRTTVLQVGANENGQPATPAQKSALRSKDPFRDLFKPSARSSFQPGMPRENARIRQKNPTIECGLVVWHVDASGDPRIRVEVPKTPAFTIRRVAPPPCDK